MGVRERLERLKDRPIRSTEDAEVATEAARLLGELLLLEERARSLERREPSSSSLLGMPLHEAVGRVLSDRGRPMHVRELGREVYRRGWRHPRPPYQRPDRIEIHLASMMANYSRKFERVAPNTFGLRAAAAPGPARPPRLGFVRGGHRGVAASELTDDAPMRDEDTAWRSS